VSSVINRSPRTGLPSLEDLAIRSGMTSEHVLLEEEDGLDTDSMDAGSIQRRLELSNPARGTRTVLEVFADGALRVTERERDVVKRCFSLDLRHFAPRLLTSRRGARMAGKVAWLFAGSSATASLLGYFDILRGLMMPIAIASALIAAGSARAYVKRIEERVAFRTRHGQALVPVLTTNFGCVREGRKLARTLLSVAKQAQRRDQRAKNRKLRAEIREHYRLAETGVISPHACAAAVQRTLTHFG